MLAFATVVTFYAARATDFLAFEAACSFTLSCNSFWLSIFRSDLSSRLCSSCGAVASDSE